MDLGAGGEAAVTRAGLGWGMRQRAGIGLGGVDADLSDGRLVQQWVFVNELLRMAERTWGCICNV